MAAEQAVERHGVGLADARLADASWSISGVDGESAEHVRDLLATMLFATDGAAVRQAYFWIENRVTAQGDLSECAPVVVSVIMAALAEDSVFPPNLGPVLDFLGLILAGSTARWLVAAGGGGLRSACYHEAMKGYWSLTKITLLPEDPYNNAGLASELVEMLDEETASPHPD